jgi:hypothetical protein
MMAQNDYLLGSEAARGDHAAKSDGAVSDDSDAATWAHAGAQGRVVASRHHVRQGQERRHERAVWIDREPNEGPVRLRNAHGFSLSAVDPVVAVPPSVEARGVHSLPAEGAGSVGPEERRGHEVTGLKRADLGADGLDDADELMPHAPAGAVGLHGFVRPEIAAADRRVSHANKCVTRFGQLRIRYVLDADIPRAVHDSRAHPNSPLRLPGMET